MKTWIASLLIATSASAQTTDPFQKDQWYLDNFGAPIKLYPFPYQPDYQKGIKGVDIGWVDARAQILEAAKNPVVVAVIDSGVDPLHPDLSGRLTADGFDFLDRQSPLTDSLGHGTHIAGLIGAVSGNGIGVSGISPPAIQILPLRVLSNGYRNFLYKGRLISDYVADAIRYAVEHKAAVINLSLGWPKLADNNNVRNAIRDAAKAGVTIIAAAGNDHKEITTFPCAYEEVLCVGAITNNGEASFFSNFGGTVDILAPGDVILSLIPTTQTSLKYRVENYDWMSGTSQAAPQISAMAAILKSMNPAMTSDEIKARLFAASRNYSTIQTSLYGTPKIAETLKPVTLPQYHPNFKGSGELLLDETTQTVRATLDVRNVGITAAAITVTLRVKDQVVGEAKVDSFPGSSEVSVPWSYHFPTLTDSFTLPFSVEIKDSHQTQVFSNHYRITRNLDQMKAALTVKIPRQSAEGRIEWFDTSSPVVVSRLRPVPTVGSPDVVPMYYATLPSTPQGVPVQIFDPTASNPLKTLIIPNLQNLNQVLRMDLKGDGKLCWIFTGNFRTKDFDVFQFQFMAPDFTPLYGTSSIWQMPIGGTLGMAVVRDYSKPGSWIRAGDLLVPAILLEGPFPDLDNFPKLDIRRFSSGTHLYYLSPRVTPQGVLLDTRVVDKPKFWNEHPQIKLLNLLPLNSKDEIAGRLKVLASEGQGLSAPIKILEISNVDEIKMQDAPEWSTLSAAGNLIRVQGSSASVLFNTFDSYTGAITWSDGNGAYRGNHYFSEYTPFDPLAGLRAVFDLGGDPVFFLFSSYRLKGIRGKTRSELPLNFDSSLPGQTFSDLLYPLVVGSKTQPRPGVMIDSTRIQGDQISIAIWNTNLEQLETPLQYSLSLPPRCLPLVPLTQYSDENLFALPLLCDRGDTIEYRIITPGTL